MILEDGEHEEILSRVRDWLTRTSREVADVQDAGGCDAQYADRGDLNAGCVGTRDPAPARPEIGLLQVVEALTAMRHELKLQTKNGRSLEESLEAARQSLDAAMRQFQSVQACERESALRAGLPLAEILAGLDESLARGERAFQATYRQLTEWAPRQLEESLDWQFRQLPWWRRWWMRKWHAQVRQHVAQAMMEIAHEEFGRLLEGYRLTQFRLSQGLQKTGVTRIPTVGHRVDPQVMTVVELADECEGMPETVVEELRPGYLWHETVIRFAEVRAVRSAAAGAPADQDTGSADM